jgi:energy-coupling factor transporter ATP-binding protein EcfA2
MQRPYAAIPSPHCLRTVTVQPLALFQDGVNPAAPTTLKRENLIRAILETSVTVPFVLLKGPPGCGKTSLLVLLEDTLRSDGQRVARVAIDEATALDFQLMSALFDMQTFESSPEAVRFILCDDIQRKYSNDAHDGACARTFCVNQLCTYARMIDMIHLFLYFRRCVRSKCVCTTIFSLAGVDMSRVLSLVCATGEWQRLLKGGFLAKHNVHIIAAATRRLQSDPNSPMWNPEDVALFGFDRLRLTDDESRYFISVMMPMVTRAREALPDDMSNVVSVIVEQCGGHAAAITSSLFLLHNFARNLPVGANVTEGDVISHLLSRAALSQYSRIWSHSPEFLEDTDRADVQRAVWMSDTHFVSASTQGLLARHVLISECPSDVRDFSERPWAEVKSDFITPLAFRRFWDYLFPDRAIKDPESIDDLIVRAITTFHLKDVIDSSKASCAEANVGVPKETCIQHMFFAGLTQSLSPTTEVVAEMSAIFPVLDGESPGELDFYVNGKLRFGIELMRNGDKLLKHLLRFREGGKYFTPHVKDYRLVDFVPAGFKPKGKSWHANRIVVEFSQDFHGCVVRKDRDTVLARVQFK